MTPVRNRADLPRVLCVDDEPQVLDGLRLHLRKAYNVVTADGGEEGLKALAEHGPFAVVLSDMRMPGMNGAEFLSRVKEAAPDSTRMLLTGFADVDSAISAINDGQIFRFLTKPCPPDTLLESFAQAAELNRLITAERVLLEHTLRGSITALTDILSLTSPKAFGRGARLKSLASRLAEALELPDRWQVEVAAMLSQLGALTLPESTLDKAFRGGELDEAEVEQMDSIPRVTESLLSHIPRLDDVLGILRDKDAPRARRREAASLAPQVLKVASDYDDLVSRGLKVGDAVDTLRNRENRYSREVLAALEEVLGNEQNRRTILEITIKELKVGMVFMEDVYMSSGALLVARGFVVTPSFEQKSQHFSEGLVKEPLRVALEEPEAVLEVV